MRHVRWAPQRTLQLQTLNPEAIPKLQFQAHGQAGSKLLTLREDKASGEAHVTGVDRRHPLYRAHRRWPETETASAVAASEAAANDASGAVSRPPGVVLGYRACSACWNCGRARNLAHAAALAPPWLPAATTHRQCFISVAHSLLRSAVSLQGCALRSCSGRTSTRCQSLQRLARTPRPYTPSSRQQRSAIGEPRH
jgi:hypothetical protein